MTRIVEQLPESPAPVVLDAFVSYSRRDAPRVMELVQAARARGRTLWVDTDDIPPGAPWRTELGTAIEAASAVICCVSPAWPDSEECRREYRRAVELGKRLIPLQVSPVDDPPAALTALQWIIPNGSASDAVVDAILAAIDTDPERVREHTHGWRAHCDGTGAAGVGRCSCAAVTCGPPRTGSDAGCRALARPAPSAIRRRQSDGRTSASAQYCRGDGHGPGTHRRARGRCRRPVAGGRQPARPGPVAGPRRGRLVAARHRSGAVPPARAGRAGQRADGAGGHRAPHVARPIAGPGPGRRAFALGIGDRLGARQPDRDQRRLGRQRRRVGRVDRRPPRQVRARA